MHHPSSASELRLTEITGSGGMAGYDTITMSTTTPNDILRLNAQNTGHMLPMDVFGHDLTFGEGDSMLYVHFLTMDPSPESTPDFLDVLQCSALTAPQCKH
jgi:hypothetical protein